MQCKLWNSYIYVAAGKMQNITDRKSKHINVALCWKRLTILPFFVLFDSLASNKQYFIHESIRKQFARQPERLIHFRSGLSTYAPFLIAISIVPQITIFSCASFKLEIKLFEPTSFNQSKFYINCSEAQANGLLNSSTFKTKWTETSDIKLWFRNRKLHTTEHTH